MLAFLEECADLFSNSLHDFSHMKGTHHYLNLEDACLFRVQSYQKSKVEEAQIVIELRQCLMQVCYSCPKAIEILHSSFSKRKTA